MKKPRLFIVSGTRPEVIKLAPLYLELIDQGVDVLWVTSGQHSRLQEQAFDFFKIKPSFVLPEINRLSLPELYGKLILELTEFFLSEPCDGIIVQGDTATTYAAAMVGYLLKKRIFHVEAGLRSNDLNAPFPEEANRKLVSVISDLHFCPTDFDKENLLKESVAEERIFVVGNTIIDTLKILDNFIENKKIMVSGFVQTVVSNLVNHNKKIILFTMHRKESLLSLANEVLKKIKLEFDKQENQNLSLIYISHPNKDFLFIQNYLKLNFKESQLIILEPLDYQDFIFLLKNASLILSDSGGAFEESVSLSKPIICLREKSERFFVDFCKSAWLIGNNLDDFGTMFNYFLSCDFSKNNDLNKSIFGDGQASCKIVNVIKKFFKMEVE